MKFIKKIAAMGAAMVMAVSMMSVNASASVTYNWTLSKGYNQPTNTAKCSGEVTGLTASNDDAIDFYCSSMSNTDATVKFIIEASFRKVSNQVTYLYYAGDSDTAKFKSNWYTYAACQDGRCTVTGSLVNDTSVTYTARGTAK